MRPAKSQRGVALIMAVLIVALATMLAVHAASEGYMDQRRTTVAMSLDQAFQIGLGGEALAADALQQDGSATIDDLTESWATPIRLPIDDGIGEISGQLEDLQGRFNINSVLNADGSKNPETLQQFQRLLTLLDIDPKFATMWVDWIDENQTEEFPDGAEDSVYSRQTPSHLTANLPVTRTSELLVLPGLTGADYRKLRPHVAALPLGSKINLCTATAFVIDSLKIDAGTSQDFSTPAGIDNLNQSRRKGCFPKIADIRSAFASDAGFNKLISLHADYLAENTSYFQANILVTLGTTELALYSVMHRSGSGNNAQIQVIQRSFGTP